mgnify:FL=1
MIIALVKFQLFFEDVIFSQTFLYPNDDPLVHEMHGYLLSIQQFLTLNSILHCNGRVSFCSCYNKSL